MDMDMPIWEQDKFMMPVIEDDALLMYGMKMRTVSFVVNDKVIIFCK